MSILSIQSFSPVDNKQVNQFEHTIDGISKEIQKEASEAEIAIEKSLANSKKTTKTLEKFEFRERVSFLNSLSLTKDYSHDIGEMIKEAKEVEEWASVSHVRAKKVNNSAILLDLPTGETLKEKITKLEVQSQVSLASARENYYSSLDVLVHSRELIANSRFKEFTSPGHTVKKIFTSANTNVKIARKAYDEAGDVVHSLNKLYNLTKDTTQLIEPGVRIATKDSTGFKPGIGKLTDKAKIFEIKEIIDELKVKSNEAEEVALKDFTIARKDVFVSRQVKSEKYSNFSSSLGFRDEFDSASSENLKKARISKSSSLNSYKALDYINYDANKLGAPNDDGLRESVEVLYRKIETALEKSKTNYTNALNRLEIAKTLSDTLFFPNSDENEIYKTNLKIAKESFETAKTTYNATYDIFNIVRELEEKTRAE